MTQSDSRRGQATFFIVWFGQLISLFGSNMTTFALSIWVYEQTGSVTRYSLAVLFTLVPLSIMTPIAGTLVDRFDRRRIMLYADTIAGMNTLVIAALVFSGQLEVWHIYIAAIVNAMANAFQNPAYHATITLIVPKRHYGRAAGMLQLSEALALVLALPIAGMLLVAIDLEGIILLDFTTFAFAFITLLLVRFPKPPVSKDSVQAGETFVERMVFGVRYVFRWPQLVALTVYGVFFLQVVLGLAQTLITPLILSFAEPNVYGLVVSAVGLGALVGGALLSVWGGPEQRVRGIFIFAIPYGIGLIIGGLQPNAFLIALGGFTLAVAHAMVIGLNRAIWHVKIPPDLQGRVFSIRILTGMTGQTLGTVLAGPLADEIFEPMMARGTDMARQLGPLIGSGQGRGIGLLFIVLGVCVLAVTALVYTNPRVRSLETNIPDAVLEGQLADAAQIVAK